MTQPRPRRKIAQPKISCPRCGHQFSEVTNTRPSILGVYRRRQCRACGARYNTEEVYRSFAAHDPKQTRSS